MPGAYTAVPEDEPEAPDIPDGWRPTWPNPGPLPPGYTPDYNISFVSPTPGTVYPGEEITVRVAVKDTTWPTTVPSGTVIIVAAVDEVATDSTSISSWSYSGGFWGADWTFTPSIDTDDLGNTLDLSAAGSLTFTTGQSYSVSDTDTVDIENSYGYTQSISFEASSFTGHTQWQYDGQLTLQIKDADNNTECICQWAFSRTSDPINFPGDNYTTGPTVSDGSLPEYINVTKIEEGYSISIDEGDLDSTKSYQWIFNHTGGTGFSGEPTVTGSATGELTKGGETLSSFTAGNGSSGVSGGPFSYSTSASLTIRIADSTEPLFEVLAPGLFPDGIYDDVDVS